MTTSEDGPEIKASKPEEIGAFFAERQKTVLTFLGFSGSGYEKPEFLLKTAADHLDDFDPSGTIVNIGATPDGIGAIFELAKDRGFMTTGIVSTEAIRHAVTLSPFADHIFIVQDETWGGFLKDTKKLSPTSEINVQVSNILIAIGGGPIARDELLEAKRRGKRTSFIPAEKNRAVARENARRQGLPVPSDFRGAAELALALDAFH